MKTVIIPPPASNPGGQPMTLLYAETDADVEQLRQLEEEGLMNPSASFAELRADQARHEREVRAAEQG